MYLPEIHWCQFYDNISRLLYHIDVYLPLTVWIFPFLYVTRSSCKWIPHLPIILPVPSFFLTTRWLKLLYLIFFSLFFLNLSFSSLHKQKHSKIICNISKFLSTTTVFEKLIDKCIRFRLNPNTVERNSVNCTHNCRNYSKCRKTNKN